MADSATLSGSLSNRTALVTGASQGIGRAIALRLAADGAHLILAARNQAKLEAVAAEITSAGGRATIQPLDIGDEASIKAAAKAALAHTGTVDILVNNAGMTRDGLLMRMKRADWDDVLSTNLTGTFLLTRGCAAAGAASSISRAWSGRRARPARPTTRPARRG